MTFSCQGSLVQGAALSQRFREPGIDSSYLVSPVTPPPSSGVTQPLASLFFPCEGQENDNTHVWGV